MSIRGKEFIGTLSGNASTATKATQDSTGQQINTTYIKGLSVSGKVITYTKGDGTTGTITTQDTNTTYSAGAGISLSGTTFSNSGVRSIASGSANGTISVNTNGTAANVAVKGLGSAAYTASSAYAAASHSHAASSITGLATVATSGSYNDLSNKPTSLPANGGTSTSSNWLNTNSSLTYGASGLNYFNQSTSVTSGATSNANPTNDWYHILRMNHANSQGYFVDLAFCFHSDTVAFRRIAAGSEVGWKTFIHSGNIGSQSVASATKATQDSAGQQINSTYIKGLSVSGKTITYTKGNGTTGTITTQDTVYTHPTTSGNKHIPSGGSSGQILRWSADGTAAWGADTNTWRGIQNNLTSDSTTDSLSAAQGKALKTLVDGKAASSHTHNSVLDSGNNSSATTFAYSKAGLDTTSWFAAWNGYELRAISPAKTLSTIGASASNHTHNYAGSSSAGGAAIKAIQDSAGQQINTTYIKGLSVNGKTITYTKGDGTTGTITTQDTNTTYNFSGTTFYSGNQNTAEHDANNALKNGHYYYTSNGPATSLGASTADGGLYVQSYGDTWVGQIAQDYRNGRLFVRGKNNGTWQSWLKVAVAGDIPSSLKNPNALTISLNGTSQGAYDGSSAKSINITASSIGAAASSHTHNYSTPANTIKSLSASGSTITYTKGDGTTGNVTVAAGVTLKQW